MSRTPSSSTEANSKAYLRTKVMTAGPGQLRLMLFDGALRFAEKARTGLATNDQEAAFEGTDRCQRILLELITGLDPQHDPELCERLAGLYTFLYTRLIEAHRQRDAAIVDEVIKLLAYERETWSMLLDKLAAESVPDVPPAPALPPGGTLRPTGTDPIGGSVSLEG
jgi:flagellar protein FliS